MKTTLLALLCVTLADNARAQRVIEYESGMGSRDPENSDVWILYNSVKARHEGMTLTTDSATFDTKNNIFSAFGHVVIRFSDTTTLKGDFAIYDGTTRIADVWGGIVTLVDGKTTLTTDVLSYDRNASTASYFHWGHTVHDNATLDSDKGYYHSDSRDIYLFNNVVLRDSNSSLFTDTLLYNTQTHLAIFISPTNIFSDSSSVYSEDGTYNTSSHEAVSYRATKLVDREKRLFADTLFFNDSTEYGEAFGNVVIFDTINNTTCRGRFGITDRKAHYSFVTDSALLVYVDNGDSLFLHADTLFVYSNDNNELVSAHAFRNVRLFRSDVQAVCDSLAYIAADSSLTMHYDPVVWYADYQCQADTIICFLDSAGARLALLRGNLLAIEKLDPLKFNQVAGRNGAVFFVAGEPSYADILGSARMVYYVLDDDPLRSVIGVNAGRGSDMRIYFNNRKPARFVTYGSPDMKMYPVEQLPADEQHLLGFDWKQRLRPLSPADLFRQVTK